MRKFSLGFGLPLLTISRLKAQSQVDYKHEWYKEHDGRVEVQSDTALIQAILAPWLEIRATGIYDAISGATPIGIPAANSLTIRNPLTGEIQSTAGVHHYQLGGVNAVSGASPTKVDVASASQLPTVQTWDIRRAFTTSGTLTFGPHHITPEFSYSTEHDYISAAPGLSYSLDLNQKNTTLNLNWSHFDDRTIPTAATTISSVQRKSGDDLLLGITQLLGPKTILTVNGIFGHGEGYFNDPYKVVAFQDVILTQTNGDYTLVVFPEKRPTNRTRQTGYVSVTQGFPDLDASLEGSYRFYHDSWGIFSHTAGLAWFQKVGSHVVLSPSFRYYRQSAADFYGLEFAGDPVKLPQLIPSYYSSDYRLSQLNTFTLGISATWKVRKWLDLEASYQWYKMEGLDGVTPGASYPTADIVTLGVRLWF